MDPPWRPKMNHSKEFQGNRRQANTSHQKDAYAKLVSQHHSIKFSSYLDKYAKEISSLNEGNAAGPHSKAQSERLEIPQRRRDQVCEDFSDSSDFSPCFMKTEAEDNLLSINLDRLGIHGGKTKMEMTQGGQNVTPRGQRRDTATSRDGDIESGEELGSFSSPNTKKHQKQQKKPKNSKKGAYQNADSGGELPSCSSDGPTSGQVQEKDKKGKKRSGTKDSTVLKNKEGPVNSCAADNKQQQKGQSSPAEKSRNKGARKQVFESYMATEEVSHGLKRGELIQGQIRINPKKYHEAFISSPDDMHDIFLDGVVARNRALNGDIVVVQLLPQDQWKLVRSDTDCEREPETQADHSVQKIRGRADGTMGSRDHNDDSLSRSLEIPPTGGTPEEPSALPINREKILKTAKVVYIVEKKHSRAVTGFLKLIQDKPFAKFSPVDHRVPRINVPLSDCPENFRFRPDDYANTLFICRITNWAADCNFAEGRLAKTLGQAGTIEPETEGILTEYDVDYTEFSNEVVDCLPKNLPWTIPPEELRKRRDLRSECIFTIDPSTARDLDDALSCKQLEDGNFEVGVHIADVSYFIEQGNALDAIASQRATSVYMVQKVIPMLPRLLCEELCSLNPLSDRLTFSVIWKITPQGKILSEWFGRSVIRSCVKLSYDHAQSMIESPEKLFAAEELPPVDPVHPVDEIHQAVLNLHLIAKNLRAQRFSGGALRLDQMKLSFTLDKETMMPQGCFVYQYRDSNKLVEEFMLLANIATAHHIHQKFPTLALLRRHPPPKVKMMEELQELCDQLELDIDLSSSGALHASLNSAVGNDEYTSARKDVLTHMCSRPMQTALYFCSGVTSDDKLFQHYALNVPLYTHFTSPIRRYADIIVHRLLASSLKCGPHLQLSTIEVEKQASHCNYKKSLSKKVQELSTELFFGVYVKECGPLDSEAMVMWVLDQSFDVLVLRYGMQKRVYCKMIDGLESFQHRKVGKKSELTLVWKQEDPEVPPVRQVISIFTLVEVQLKAGGDQTKYNAELKRPEDTSL